MGKHRVKKVITFEKRYLASSTMPCVGDGTVMEWLTKASQEYHFTVYRVSLKTWGERSRIYVRCYEDKWLDIITDFSKKFERFITEVAA